MLTNKQYRQEELLNSFHVNGHIVGPPRTRKLVRHNMAYLRCNYARETFPLLANSEFLKRDAGDSEKFKSRSFGNRVKPTQDNQCAVFITFYLWDCNSKVHISFSGISPLRSAVSVCLLLISMSSQLLPMKCLQLQTYMWRQWPPVVPLHCYIKSNQVRWFIPMGLRYGVLPSKLNT